MAHARPADREIPTPQRRWRRRLGSLRPGTMIVLLALLTFDTLLLVVVGLLLEIYMQHPAGLVFCAICWVGAVVLQFAARGIDRTYKRERG